MEEILFFAFKLWIFSVFLSSFRLFRLFYRFYCDIPDDFLFTNQATLDQLALAVHEGKLTDAQKALYESGVGAAGAAHAGSEQEGEDPHMPSTVMMPMTHKQPCCPWFTCCL